MQALNSAFYNTLVTICFYTQLILIILFIIDDNSLLFKMTSVYAGHAGVAQPLQNYGLPKVKLIVYNQFPGIELASPVHVNSGACYLMPAQIIHAGTFLPIDFSIDFSLGEPIGISMYELRNNRPPGNDVIFNEDEVKCIYLLIIWKVDSAGKFSVYSDLIKYDRGRAWNKNELIRVAHWYKLYDIYFPIEHTYLIRNDVALKARIGATREADGYKLEIAIFETSAKDDTWRLWYFNMDR
jgi:hypothetical protein